MTGPRIAVFAMRSWGELGNLLAARSFAGAVRRSCAEARIEVFVAEEHFPLLAAAGDEIRTITLRSTDSASRCRDYLALMQGLAEQLPAGIESGRRPGPGWQRAICSFGSHLAELGPDVVVGTKGVISRLCLAATRAAGLACPVVNFVTNHGLLQLAVHRSPHCLNLVQLGRARRIMIEDYGYQAQRIELVGPVVAGHELQHFLASSAGDRSDSEPLLADGEQQRPALVIFCNRGSEAYLDLLRHLGRHHPQAAVLFIAHNQPELIDRARQLQRQLSPSRWLIVGGLKQAEYMRRVAEVGSLPHSLLVSKAGPNTVMEALSFGLPPVVLASGLPMEEWVGELLVEKGLGAAASTSTELITEIDRLLAEPDRIRALFVRGQAYRDQYLSSARAGQRITAALHRVIEDREPGEVES